MRTTGRISTGLKLYLLTFFLSFFFISSTAGFCPNPLGALTLSQDSLAVAGAEVEIKRGEKRMKKGGMRKRKRTEGEASCSP